MTWTYKQSTGELFYDGKFIEKGYSGRMTNKNNPDRQHVKGLGPLPRGTYRIAGQTRSKGPMTIVLSQLSGDTFGRNAFRIHGERVHGVPGWASEGCIIVGPGTRRRILDSNDTVLEVII